MPGLGGVDRALGLGGWAVGNPQQQDQLGGGVEPPQGPPAQAGPAGPQADQATQSAAQQAWQTMTPRMQRIYNGDFSLFLNNVVKQGGAPSIPGLLRSLANSVGGSTMGLNGGFAQPPSGLSSLMGGSS